MILLVLIIVYTKYLIKKKKRKKKPTRKRAHYDFCTFATKTLKNSKKVNKKSKK